MPVPILHISPLFRLPDKELWENRFQVVSPSSGSTYIIAQHRQKRHWACSCRAWTTRRKCKHLDSLGLPNHEVPHEVTLVSAAPGASPVKPPKQAVSPAKPTINPLPAKPKRAISFEDV